MRLLVYGLNSAPEPIGIGKYTGEMVAWLAARGHQVHVIAAPPYYPAWRVAEGWSPWSWRRERHRNAEVFRCPLYVPARPGGPKRLLHLASFAGSSLPVALWQGLVFRPEVVIAVAPTLATAPAAWAAARLAGGRSWLHVQDLEIDAAFELGLLKGRWTRRLALALERSIYGGFDLVSSISAPMAERLSKKGVGEGRLGSLPNWVDCEIIRPLNRPSRFRDELGLPADAVVALYSGNMNEKQGLEVLADLAGRVAGRSGIALVLAGEGPARARLSDAVVGIDGVHLLPLQPAEALNDLLGLADIHLLPQRADAADLVLPSKLGGMLASGRPVIAGAAPGSGLAAAIDGCGLAVAPGDGGAMADAMSSLVEAKEKRAALGRAARLRALEQWDKQGILERFEADLVRLAARR